MRLDCCAAPRNDGTGEQISASLSVAATKDALPLFYRTIDRMASVTRTVSTLTVVTRISRSMTFSL